MCIRDSFQTDGSVLGLYQREALAEDAEVVSEGSGFRGVTLALNCESPVEVDDVYGVWLAAGADAVKPPDSVFWGGYSSYVADPDGHLWEIAHNPNSSIGPDGRMQLSEPADPTESDH